MGVAILVAEIMDVDARDGLVVDLMAACASQKPAPVDGDPAGVPVERIVVCGVDDNRAAR